MISYSSSAVVVTRYPTRLHVFCPCGHQGFVKCFLDKKPKLVCSKCGNANPRVAQRDSMATWSKQRQGK